jgi:hypothetical protein
MPCHIVELFPLLRSPHSGSRVLRLTPSRRAQLAEAPQQLAAGSPWGLAVGQRIVVERSFGGEPSLAAQQLSAAVITAVAIVTRTTSIAVEAPTTEVAVPLSEAVRLSAELPYVGVALLFAAEPPYAEVARVLPAAE